MCVCVCVCVRACSKTVSFRVVMTSMVSHTYLASLGCIFGKSKLTANLSLVPMAATKIVQCSNNYFRLMLLYVHRDSADC